MFKPTLRALAGLSILALSYFMASRLKAADENFEVKRFTIGSIPVVSLENVAIEKPKAVGSVIGSFKSQKYLASGDIVFLKMNNPALSKGDRFLIFIEDGDVKQAGSLFGSLATNVQIKGTVEITRVLPDSVEGRLSDTTSQVMIGDKVMEIIDLQIPVKPQNPEANVDGKVLRAAREAELIGAHEFAYINRGLRDGLKLNDRLYVYRTADGSEEINKKLPQVNIAELIIVHIDNKVATAYCLNATDKFMAGAAFKSARPEVTYLDDEDSN